MRTAASRFCSILSLTFISLQPVEAAERDPSTATLLALIPGAGHFYLGDYARGGAYLGSTLGFLGAGIALDVKNEDYGLAEYNAAYILASKTYELSLYSAYREAKLTSGKRTTARIDGRPESDLMLSPFHPDALSDPWVHAGWLFGAGAVALGASVGNARNFTHVTSVRRAGRDFSPTGGFLLYTGELSAISEGAAVAEEGVWRGMVQVEFEEAFGPMGGWLAASTLFGLAHALNPGSAGERIGAAVSGTFGGLYLGSLFQRRGHRLRAPIAAHFWYNMAVGITAFTLDPENNPLRFGVTFKM